MPAARAQLLYNLGNISKATVKSQPHLCFFGKPQFSSFCEPGLPRHGCGLPWRGTARFAQCSCTHTGSPRLPQLPTPSVHEMWEPQEFLGAQPPWEHGHPAWATGHTLTCSVCKHQTNSWKPVQQGAPLSNIFNFSFIVLNKAHQDYLYEGRGLSFYPCCAVRNGNEACRGSRPQAEG